MAVSGTARQVVSGTTALRSTARGAAAALAALLIAGALTACTSGPPESAADSVPDDLLQPQDLPVEPGRVVADAVLPDASASWGCAGVEHGVLERSGWTSASVRYADVAGTSVYAARFRGGDDPSAAVTAVRTDIADCRSSPELQDIDDALLDLDLGPEVLAYQSNDPDGEREGQRSYAVDGDDIVQITVLYLDGSSTISLQALTERAVARS